MPWSALRPTKSSGKGVQACVAAASLLSFVIKSRPSSVDSDGLMTVVATSIGAKAAETLSGEKLLCRRSFGSAPAVTIDACGAS